MRSSLRRIFVWEKKPKTTLYSDDVFIDIFNQRHKYCYEYSGTFSEIVVTPEFEIALLTLFICYDDHKLTIIRGGVGSGKTGLFTLACSILGKQHQIRKISKEIDTLKNDYKDIGLLLRTVSHLATTQPGLLPWQRFQTAEYIIWKGRMDLSDTEPIIEKTFKNESSLTKLFAKVFEENEFAKYETRLGLKGDESQLETVKQVLFSLKVSKKVILCGSPVSGKSSVLKITGKFNALFLPEEKMYENERFQGNLEVIRLRPNCYNCQELFGTRQCNEWKDGTLTSSLKKEGKENKWIVSPKFISTCTLIIATSRKLNWILLLDQWIEHKDATQSWKVGYEDSIRDIVIWLCPAILKFIEQHTKPVIPFIPIHSVRCFLSCFTILLTEALPNLKEKKYLRMWIQAAIVVSIVWTMGSTLTIPDRSKFDVYLRDILSGKKQEYPLPASLNNKFDAIPPSEGTIYDFIFDFKARGQWKHWTDIIKNLSPEDSITYYENKPIVHSVDSLRYNLPLENSFNLENMYYVLCMTIGLKDSPETDYDKELYSRTWSLFNPEPHEDILARIFSSSMNATFRRIGFPPEISSVIPAIINSTLNVYNACRKALIIENEMCFLHIDTVNLRDIVNVLQCFSLLPKENADNKKLFTRLWVHEILRVFYDRLLCDDAKKMIYDSIRECVKNNFRENFESGFEHLGKINGLVTQQNLRNLMFGVYLSDNKKDPHYMEMTDVEQFEKKLLGKIKDFNASEDSQNDPVHLFPLRTTLEMISRICRQLNLPQGHMLIYGEGVEGRRITIRSAAILLGIKYIEVENYKSYDDLTWRLTIRDIIKRNVHKLMMENENNGGKSNSPPIDITPAILEKEFISNCEKKLHIMFIIDNDDTSVFEFLRSHRSIVGRSIVYRKEEWPEDTLKKAGDFVFEELSLSRKIKKALNQFCVFAYTEARKLSNKVKEKKIRISPSVYLRLLRHVVHIHSEKSGELEQRKSRLQIGIEKFNQVEEELKEFELELESIREKIQNVKKEKEEMKSTKFNLDELLESVKTRYEEVSSQLDEYIQQKGEKEHIYKDKLARIEDKYSGLRNSMGNLKISEIQALKNVKFNLPLLKLCLQCMNLYSINDGEKGLETDPKKEVEPYVEEVNRLSVLIDEKELLKDETYEKIQTTQDKINDVEGKIKKIQSSYEQLMIELDRCLEKKSLGNLVYDNFKGVIEFWSNILSKIKEDLITLLGDVAFYSMDIVLCSPFTLDQSDTILSQKNAKEKLKLDNVVNQMIRTTKSIEDLTDELLSSLDIEKSILDVPGLGNKLMENEKEFSRLRCLYDNLEMFQRKLNNSTDDDHSLRLAKKCSIIFEVIRKLTYLDNYDITLKKFLSIIKVSLMNKEHQDRIPIPEVLNQLRSMFSDRAHYSIFVFWLYFYLNFNGSNMNVLKLIEELMNGQCSGFFDEAISIFCDFFSEEKADLILDVNKNKLFFNLLPQPWLSRLNPFQIFVLKTIGQPHRVIDLAQEFSNNFDIDSTFVDVLESDFGQFPSSMSNKAIVLSTNDEESEEEIRLINKFSGRQKINSIFISFDEGIQVISDVMIKAQKLGKWIIITDYRSDNFEDLKKLIARNNFQVHKDFKLWILNYKRQIPKEIWRECLVINQSPPDTFHQRFTSLLVNGISDEEFMTLPHSESDPESADKIWPRGGWNIPYKFNQSHFRIVTELFKTHFIRLPFEHNRAQCLRAIIIDCFYKQYLSDERDFNLLSTMFHTLMSTSQINLKKISSVSDMVEVAKSLEENQIISLLNISQCTQSFYQFKKSKDFMKTLIMYPSGGEDVLLSQETGFNKNIIELNALSHARIFLNGLVLHIMKESIETDGLCGSFIDEIPSLSPGNIFYLKGVKLEGASWDPRRSALIAETARLESFSIISLRKGNLKKKEQNYSCPFYLTQSRVLNDSSSSFHFNIYIPTLMSQEKHVEMSTAVMIEDFE
ncbi:DNAH [Lepeophtheirus salmonis]|uniref:DNAH n=1 Tax=Lepeophtheirus salmonis TaxID=72036 RepID=A0A7R8H9Z0_LEPSM|nr:DNAH [Lepeophtheirus salmonis]CAF2968461.1 DNAH [Lepeophtheirus salmonis]